MKTKDKLVHHGRRLMWRHGYSNVSLRQVAAAAGVDVALVSRHFGGKFGLFDATLEGAFEKANMEFANTAELVDGLVEVFVTTPRGGDDPSILQMLLMNAGDADVGPHVRDLHEETLQARLEQIIGDRSGAALFMAVIMGFSIAEKTLHLKGIAKDGTPEYPAQLRHLMNGALGYWD